MVEKTVIVNNPLGIHARPAALLVEMASKFQAKIFLSKADIRGVNGKSIMSVMMLAAENGAEVTVNAEGEDADRAVEALTELLESNFEDKI